MVLHVPTVFASRRGGTLLIRVAPTSPIAELEGEVVTTITYSYLPIDDSGRVLAQVNDIVDARVPTIGDERGFDEAAVLKSIVVWNMVDSFHAASNAYHLDVNPMQALETIEALALYVDDANLILEDEEIARDRAELINQFAINLGGYIGEPTYHDEMPMGGCGEHTMAHSDCHGDDVYYPFYCGAAPGATLPVVLVGLMLFVVRRFKRPAATH